MDRHRLPERRNLPAKGANDPVMLTLLHLFLLVLLCLVIYYNSLSNGFVYDDYGAIVENKYINQPGRLFTSLFDPSYFKYAGLEASYRPVSTLSYFAIHSVAGLDPLYYHLVSLILHTFNTLLVYQLATFVLRQRLPALIAGLLFASHPVLTEAVNCIDFNDDLLMTFFFLPALICYIRSGAGRFLTNFKLYVTCLVLYLLSLLSKEMAIMYPAIALLYDLMLRDADGVGWNLKSRFSILKRRFQFYTGLVLVSLVYLILRFGVLYNPGEASKASAGSLFERVIFLPGHILKYIILVLYPADLNADYVYAYPGSIFDLYNLMGSLVVLALVVSAFLAYRFSREISFSIGWFLITLFPVYNLIEIYHPLAERYLYLPIIGFCLAVPAAINAALKGRFTQHAVITRVTLLPVVVIVGIYSYATIQRNPIWQSNYSLWSDTVRKSPDSLVARGGLGMAYLEKGMLDDAARQFKLSIERYPNHHKSYYNLGLVYHRQGDLKKAVALFNRSIGLDPNSVRAHYNLATIYLQQQMWDLAIQHYVRVNELDPEIATAHFNLGMAYAGQGKLKSAVSEWEIVLKLDPRNEIARKNILKAQKMMGRQGE